MPVQVSRDTNLFKSEVNLFALTMDQRDALVGDRAVPRSALYRFIQCGRLCKNVMKQSYCSQIEILRQMKSEKIVVESLCD